MANSRLRERGFKVARRLYKTLRSPVALPWFG